jgi:hypothetical protein
MTSVRSALPAVLVALASACAAPSRTSTRPAPARSTAAVHHEVRVTLDPGGQRVAVEDEVTLSPDLRARLGDEVAISLHAGLSPERMGGGAPLTPRSGPPPAHGGDEEGPPVPLEHFAVRLAPGERTFAVRYGGRIFHPIEEHGE